MKSIQGPSRNELVEVYDRFQSASGQQIGETELIRWAHWARIDQRLAEILVRFLASSFRNLNPFALREENLRSPQPQALAVLVEFAGLEAKRTLSVLDSKAFRIWSHVITVELEPAPPQMFFVNDGAPKPKRDLEQIRRSLKAYRRWGFFGTDNLSSEKRRSNIASDQRQTMLGREERMRILDQLLETQNRLTVADYLKSCELRVHRRTAERDLGACPRLKKSGRTRNRTYARIPAAGRLKT